MSNTVHRGFVLMEAGAENPEIGLNKLQQFLDVMATQGRMVQRALTAPPSPSEGDLFIVGASATGAWAGQDNNLAHYINSGWTFYTPSNGLAVWVVDEEYKLVFVGEPASGSWKARTGECILSMIDAAGGTNVDAGAALPWDTEQLKRGGGGDGHVYEHTANDTDITIKESGHYHIHFEACAYTAAGGTSEDLVRFWLRIDGSEVNGSRSYSRVRGGLEAGTQAVIDIVVALAVDEVLSVFADRITATNSCLIRADTQRITIRKV